MSPGQPVLRATTILLFGAFAASTSAAQRAQAPVTTVTPVPPPATQLEELLTRPNVLVTQDLYRISDRLSTGIGLTIDAVIATELLPAAARLQGLRVEVNDPGPPERSRRSYVDLSELAGLSQGLNQMITVAGQWTGREDSRATEARFATADGFAIGFHQDSRNQQGYVVAGLVDPARHTCAVQDFATIKAAVDDAIALLKDK